ncbi:MAG: hypothetical protein N2Z68_02825 [Patescibacteria group bacterium]|nr:hypothetical protein [Patescibacteria group bacterium]
MNKEEYLKLLKKRAFVSRIYRSYQLVGLTLASLLSDRKHKTLYIKLAKEIDNQLLLELVKDIAQRNLKKPAAYFMAVLEKKGLIPKGVKKPKQGRIKLKYKKSSQGNKTNKSK